MINFTIASVLLVVALQGCNWREERIKANSQQQEENTPQNERMLLDEQMKREEDTREVNVVPEGDS